MSQGPCSLAGGCTLNVKIIESHLGMAHTVWVCSCHICSMAKDYKRIDLLLLIHGPIYSPLRIPIALATGQIRSSNGRVSFKIQPKGQFSTSVLINYTV